MIDNNVGRTWSNAPMGVRNARALAWLGALGCGCTLIMLIVLVVTSALSQDISRTIVLLIDSIMFPFYVSLINGLKIGSKMAYKVQRVLSIIGLINLPVGTLINAYILFYWTKPETKAWFGV